MYRILLYNGEKGLIWRIHMSYQTVKIDIGTQIGTRKKEIANQIFDELSLTSQSTYTEETKPSRISYFEKLVELIGQSLRQGESSYEQTYQWGKEIGKLATQYGTPLHTSIQSSTLYKQVILEDINKSNDEFLTKDLLLQLTIAIDHIFGTMITAFSEAYNDYAQEQLKASEEKYLSLSTPVVPIFDNLAVLPLIGQIEEARAEMMAEHVLVECKKLSINRLIIDLSGVYEVNPLFQEGIMKLIASLKLLGIEPILSGMRPEMSIEFIETGINLSGINIYQSLNKAVESHQSTFSNLSL